MDDTGLFLLVLILSCFIFPHLSLDPRCGGDVSRVLLLEPRWWVECSPRRGIASGPAVRGGITPVLLPGAGADLVPGRRGTAAAVVTGR